MIYSATEYETIKSLEDIEVNNIKTSRVDDDLKSKTLVKQNYREIEELYLSDISDKIPYNEYFYIQCNLGRQIDGFLIRKIKLKVDEDEVTPCVELFFMQEDEVVRYYRLPLDSGRKLNEVINRKPFISRIKTYYENSKNIEKDIEQEQLNILEIFILVKYFC